MPRKRWCGFRSPVHLSVLSEDVGIISKVFGKVACNVASGWQRIQRERRQMAPSSTVVLNERIRLAWRFVIFGYAAIDFVRQGCGALERHEVAVYASILMGACQGSGYAV